MVDKNFKLTEYIQYDTNLGREQNIELGKDSSLDPSKTMYPTGGVVIRQFAPQKLVPGYRSQNSEQGEMSISEQIDNSPGNRSSVFRKHTG